MSGLHLFVSFMHTTTRCTVLPTVSHYSSDLQVAIMWQEKQQCANKGREEEDRSLVNMNVNNAGFKILTGSALQMLYDKGNAFNTFVRP